MELQKPFIFHLTYQAAAVWLKNLKDLIFDGVSQALAISNDVYDQVYSQSSIIMKYMDILS